MRRRMFVLGLGIVLGSTVGCNHLPAKKKPFDPYAEMLDPADRQKSAKPDRSSGAWSSEARSIEDSMLKRPREDASW